MKRLTSIILSIVFAFSSIFISFAHSGRTDSNGGHKDNKNKSGLGSYHYHCGGYPPHLHTNGICPYKQKTSNNNTTSSSSSSSSKANPSTSSSSQASSSKTSSSQKQKIIVTTESTNVYEKASLSSEKLATVKEGYTFTPTGSTKSFWKYEFKKKDDDMVYTGYISKADTKEA